MAKLGIVKVGLDREVNGYIVSCASSREAVVIDAGLPSEKLIGQLRGLTVRWVVATHGHPGHLAGKDDVKGDGAAVTAMHMADAKQYLRSADRYLLDGDELEFGEFKLTAIHTPGHTAGSLCFLVGNHLFTGDTLLAGRLGKEMPGADLRQQLMSVVNRLVHLSPGTAVYPGHGPLTSIGSELASNPYLQGLRRA